MIKYVIFGTGKIIKYLDTLPRNVIRTAMKAVVEYIIGDERHGLAHDDPYVQTTRKAVYGRSFESDKQRAYVMAAIKRGEIKIGQRQRSPTEASGGYTYKMTRGGYGATITNPKEGAYWSRMWGGWKNWRTIPQVINVNIRGAIRHANAEIKRFLAK